MLSGRQLLILVRAGVLRPGRPGSIVGQVAALGAWGLGFAGELRQAVARSPRSIAVIDDQRGAVTYAALLDGADRAAAALLGHGLRPGDRVGLMCRNHLMLVEALAGASALGVDVVLVNTGLAASQIAATCAEQQVELLIHDDEFASVVEESKVPTSGHTAVCTETGFHAQMMEAERADLSPPPRSSRTIVLTSGTTGAPRGARRPVPRSIGGLASMLDRIPLRVGDTVLLSAPIFHTWGLAGLQLSLALRSTIVLQRTFDAAAARMALREHHCQVMYAVPVMLQRMLRLPSGPSTSRPGRAAGDQLRVVATSGSSLPPGLAPAFLTAYGPVLYNLYGSTEVSWATVATPRDLARAPATAGRPPLGTRLAVVDPNDKEVPGGQIGRVFVGNDMVFHGYTSGPQKEVWQGLVATGDLGHIVDGLLFIDEREDDLVISGGENVRAAEVEGVLTAMPGVLEAAVFGVDDEEFGQRLVAYVVPEAAAEVRADEVLAYVAARVARHAHPREVVVVRELPRNETGKVLVRELRRRHPRDERSE